MTVSLLTHHQRMARYNQWANEALYTACERLPDDERKRDRGAFFGSLHGTLNHILWADVLWLRRFAAFHPLPARHALPALPEGASYGTVLHQDWAQLRATRREVDALVVDWLQDMPAAKPEEPIRYTTMKGEARSLPFWLALTHLFNHQTHHRGQATTLLSQHGIDPGPTDLVAMPD